MSRNKEEREPTNSAVNKLMLAFSILALGVACLAGYVVFFAK